MKILFAIIGLLMLNINLESKIITENYQYNLGDDKFEGFVAYNDEIKSEMPIVIIVHDWMGVGEYSKMRAKQLAELGYFAFAADIYGKDIRPKDAQEAGTQAKKYYADRKLYRERVNLALTEAKKFKNVSKQNIAAIGYCFGGSGVLELARSGADIKGVVTFHGNLDSPTPDDAKNIKSKVLVLHGADDPYVPKEQIEKFQTEMKNAKVDWQMVYYNGAVHSFSNPFSGNDNSKGAAYNESADKRSWNAMLTFFNEIFK